MTQDAKHILVVEDTPSIQKVYKSLLEGAGYTVTLCGDGKQATELVAKNTYDMIFLDYVLPSIDGVTVLETIRQSFTMDRLPVVMVTSKAQDWDRELAMRKGATQYVIKPLTEEQLLSLAAQYTGAA